MQEIYVSTDIETDGPIPGPYSMLSLASVAYDESGNRLDDFTVNLRRLADAGQHPDTMAWWAQQPEAWAAATRQQEDPEVAISKYCRWVKKLPGKAVFVGYPVGFDFTFVYWYCVRFTGKSPFSFSALDMKTMAMTMLKTRYRETSKRTMPRRWFSEHVKHTHVALDDAAEQGATFCAMLKENRG